MLHNYLIQVKFKGVKNLLCAQGRAGQTQLPFSWRCISQSEIRNSAAAKAKAGPEGETSFPYGVNKNSCFLLAPLQAEGFAMGPARAFGFQNSKSGFSSKKVRILTKRHRQFSKFGFWAIVAPALPAGRSPRQRRGSGREGGKLARLCREH